MAWRVELTERFLSDLDLLYGYIGAAESDGAARWIDKLQETLALLATAPHIGKPLRNDLTARELIYGNKPHLYRIVYECDEAAQTIYINFIPHGRRLPPST